MKTLALCIAAFAALAAMSTAAIAAQPPNPVPGPPVAYACEDTGTVAIWDDQYFPNDDPLCASANQNFLLCLAKFGQFQIETPSATTWAPVIVGMYLEAGAGATQGKCIPAGQDRTYWLCYGTGANSLRAVATTAAAARALAAGERVPNASRTIQTSTKVGDYYLTCDDQGQKPTGRVVSTGNAGEVVSGSASTGAGLLLTNPLDYTKEIA